MLDQLENTHLQTYLSAKPLKHTHRFVLRYAHAQTRVHKLFIESNKPGQACDVLIALCSLL